MRGEEIIEALELLEFCKSIARSGENVLLTPDTIFSIDKIIKSKDKQIEAVKLMHINDVKKKDAEIERLQKAIKVQDIMIEQQDYKIKKAKSEAREEFAEKICAGRLGNDPLVIAVKAELKEMEE